MPMKANHHELDEFVSLAREINADRIVLRPLNFSDRLTLITTRAGYTFNYRAELLPFEQLVWISGRTKALCDRAGIPLSDQMEFGGSFGEQFRAQYTAGLTSLGTPALAPASVAPPALPPNLPPAMSVHEAAVVDVERPEPDVATRAPICTEPWKSLYVLRRGVFPCCYGGKPLAPMDQAPTVWNSKPLANIRSSLQAGRFPGYCLDSPACPIVRKQEESREMNRVDALRLRARHWASVAHRGITAVRWAGQWSRIRARRIVTEPEYRRLHAGRIRRMFQKSH
jgi:hypothetical protein